MIRSGRKRSRKAKRAHIEIVVQEKIEKKETKEKIKVKNKEEINKIPDQKIPQKQKQVKK